MNFCYLVSDNKRQNPDMKSDRLREVREQRGLTQKDLAERTGLAANSVYRYETGENDPAGDILARLARELDVSSDYLLGLVDDPKAILTEEDLSPMERKLLQAVRKGLIVEALETLTSLSKHRDQPEIASTEPAVNS
jgi:repressor LexA